MIKNVNHIGIAVNSIETALPFYTETLGLTFEAVEHVAEQRVRVAFIDAGNCKLELLEPTSPDSPVAKFIEKRGEGIHHVALSVESIEDRIQEMMDKGIPMIDKQSRVGAGGANIAFMHPKASNGVLVEFCEKAAKQHDN
ncbi:methylmalonyl-CoA epimerase [Sutcliffiella horikoshii]|uniref:Methylmalonyl-CoA epimerase n=1 Tax=Sutcliffiella horikoshii TaxID=79883 RepID=A0A5D4T0T1_9BACI|nr:methylmalonyl-CoA epimerase [Sutcliffiella horikoshii]TYS68208.1 methylmalonyl-CoA epimerase [Sutcliffiella horikoshii]